MIWNEIIKKNNNSFLQSYEWGCFQEKIGRKPFYFIYNGNNWLLLNEIKQNTEIKFDFCVLILEHKLPFSKKYFYLPKINLSNLPNLERLIDRVRNLKKDNLFLKIEPLDKDIGKGLLSFNIQPRQTIVLNLAKTEERLLLDMHQKTRYNIKIAQKHGVTIEIDEKMAYFEDFWRLMVETAKRNNFRTYPKLYYKELLECLPFSQLMVAKYQNKIIAAIIIVIFNNIAYYLHGASDYNFRNIMAPYLIQWKAILKAKEMGCYIYDFWGIDEKKWPGITRFKKGFGGEIIKFPSAFDFIFDKFWYWVYRLGRWLF